jgi:Tfp pilus assembly protein PilF
MRLLVACCVQKAADEALEEEGLQDTGNADCVYARQQLTYLSAVGKYKIGDVGEARSLVNKVLDQDPSRNDANDLFALVEQKYKSRRYNCLSCFS